MLKANGIYSRNVVQITKDVSENCYLVEREVIFIKLTLKKSRNQFIKKRRKIWGKIHL